MRPPDFPTHAADAAAAARDATPPVAISALSVAGVSLQDWVFIATLVYLALQGAYLVWKFLRERSGQVKSDG